jgi:membrane-associated phospholipid phosphatase
MSSVPFARGQQRVALSRRAALRYGLAGAALWRFGSPARLAAEPPPPTLPGSWRTWLLTSPDELRPIAPPAPTSAELSEVRDLQGRRTAAVAATVAKWADGPAVLPWTNLALDLIATHHPSPVRAARALALLHVAVYDAVVATWDAQAMFFRPAPGALDSTIVPLGSADPGRSAFPSEHAAVAAAASEVLAATFPDEPAAGLAALADEAATSRLWAGTNVRSDVEAGLAIGRAAGARAIARGKADGSDATWDRTGRPTGEGFWQPTPPGFVQEPLDPLAGTWLTWVVAGGDQFRPAPPLSYGSPAWQAELAAVQEAIARRTPEQEAAVLFWAGGPGTATPAGLWTGIARDLVVRGGLDLPHAARVLALTSVALADAFVCCWDAKYAYWTARPITADPTLDVLIPTPPFPSYTSGHATASAAASAVLGHLFPDQAADLAVRATEAKDSRLWAGIHFPLDNEMGALGGGLVGRLLVARARADGAE